MYWTGGILQHKATNFVLISVWKRPDHCLWCGSWETVVSCFQCKSLGLEPVSVCSLVVLFFIILLWIAILKTNSPSWIWQRRAHGNGTLRCTHFIRRTRSWKTLSRWSTLPLKAMWSIGQMTRARKKGEIKAESEKKSLHCFCFYLVNVDHNNWHDTNTAVES